MNIGYVLTDSGGLAGTTPVLGTESVLSDFTAEDGGDPAAFDFVSQQTDYEITLLFADSSFDTGSSTVGTVFGYYVGATLTPIYTIGLTSEPTATEAFDPTTAGNSYGFYATVCYALGVCETYTTGEGNSGNSIGGAGWNHFALFELTDGNHVIGFTGQNGFYGEALGDFNDVVVEIKAVPEPSTLAIAAAGLVVLFGRIARRRPAPSVRVCVKTPQASCGAGFSVLKNEPPRGRLPADSPPHISSLEFSHTLVSLRL
jgi:hypothetical protein